MPVIYKEFYEMLSRNHDGNGVREFIQVLIIGRNCGRENLERVMVQALAEHRVDSERIRHLLAATDTPGWQQNTCPDYLGQSRVVLPDLSHFDRLRTSVAVGGSK
jgi:hypothetical protein